MALQTQYLLTGHFEFSPLIWCIFFSTLGLYAIHRLTGLKKVAAFTDKGRYYVISKFKNHIRFYAVVSLVLGAWFFFHLPFNLQIHFVFTGIISLGYVLPVLGKDKRFRDVHYIKIFLIAITWAWVTVILPALDSGYTWNISILWLVIERAIFIFAITLPFDIRDFHIDAHTGVKTIPSYIGMLATKRLAVTSLLFTVLFALLNLGNIYSTRTFMGLVLSILVTSVIIWYTDRIQHDYYFTGLVDGNMVWQFLLILGSGFL